MKITRIIATVAFAAITILNANVNAQSNNAPTAAQSTTATTAAQLVSPQSQTVVQQPFVGQVEARVYPSPEVIVLPPPAPKLGFTGQIVHGLGMRILTVNYGSPAQQAGLEHGDVILSANGIQIRHRGDLSRALIQAAQYRNGVVNLYVKNVRGCPRLGNQYVNVTAYLFSGPIVTSGVVVGQVSQN